MWNEGLGRGVRGCGAELAEATERVSLSQHGGGAVNGFGGEDDEAAGAQFLCRQLDMALVDALEDRNNGDRHPPRLSASSRSGVKQGRVGVVGERNPSADDF